MSETMSIKPAGRKAALALDTGLNVALPYGIYAVLSHQGFPEIQALMLSSLAPVAVAVASLVKRRRINGLSLLVLFATAASLAATALSGSTWFALIQPSFVTGTIALIFLASLAAEKPALFYLARDTTCPTPQDAATFEALWVRPIFRRTMRRLTLVWAAFLAGEAVFRAVLAAIFPSPTLVAATQILWIVLPILLVSWSIKAGKRWAQEAGAETSS